jgi:Fur family transcriptional regulator, iron response regulator
MHAGTPNPNRRNASRKPCLMAVLRMAGLRPTRQRIALAELLFTGGQRHVSAEQLHGEASLAGVGVSLATVYNALHQFRKSGLLREVTVDASCSYFDTDTSDHHHFFIEDEQRVIDIPPGSISIKGLPDAPKGMEVAHVDLVVRLRRKPRSSGA